ncbi:hypothetical protein RFI_28944 [Reticulomyxa filosa]|uniref:Uncharacterized protein n=1 Tax=Reticulomyxa filosa TaxID=46433 RepID=X6M4Q6_RETFI|nr:hypothetical protein RFI_28944 [Reticulomyxa filosa]|eukprot:ETO08442.1 hypothetical protein RFI_28944 [Reticulomyxa filosa]
MLLCVPVYLGGLIWCSTLPMYHLRYNDKYDLSAHRDATLLISSGCSSAYGAIKMNAVCEFYDLCDITVNTSASSDSTSKAVDVNYEGSHENDDMYLTNIFEEWSNSTNGSVPTTTQSVEYHHFSINRVQMQQEIFVKAQWFVSGVLSVNLFLLLLKTQDWKRYFFLLIVQNWASWNLRGIGTLTESFSGCSVVYTPYYNSAFVSVLYSSMIAVAVWVLLVIIFLQRTERGDDLKLRKEFGNLSQWEFANRCANVTVFLALVYAVVVPSIVLISINLQQSDARSGSKQDTSMKWLAADIFLTQITAYFVPDLSFSSLWLYTVMLQNLLFAVLLIIAALKFLETWGDRDPGEQHGPAREGFQKINNKFGEDNIPVLRLFLYYSTEMYYFLTHKKLHTVLN